MRIEDRLYRRKSNPVSRASRRVKGPESNGGRSFFHSRIHVPDPCTYASHENMPHVFVFHFVGLFFYSILFLKPEITEMGPEIVDYKFIIIILPSGQQWINVSHHENELEISWRRWWRC